MRKLLTIFVAVLIVSLFNCLFCYGQFINPTGTYILKGEIKKNIITGHNGEIKAKLLDSNQIALSFSINTGSPDFESAFFSDTLLYSDDRASYYSKSDSDCIITFLFNHLSVDVLLLHSNTQCTCGFQKNVVIPASFIKYSREAPLIPNAAN